MSDTSTVAEQGLNFEPPEVIRERLRDPTHLPTHAEINRAFRPSGRLWDDDWRNFCFDEQNPVYEFLNREYVGALSGYLAERVQDLGATAEQPVTILEVGAGSGRLSHFISEQLAPEMQDRVRVVATDNGNWQSVKPQFPVEQMDYAEALKKHNPAIVIGSWMPYQDDWTPAFRQAESVKEYLLIGETDGGCCASDATWGNRPWDAEDDGEGFIPEYERDNFERVDLDEISEHQICRTDAPGSFYHSRTVSFRRQS